MYTLKKMVMLQRDYRIKESESVVDFVIRYDGEDLRPENTLAVVAVNGVPYELNMSAAIILETLLSGKDHNKTAEILIRVFGIDYDLAMSSVEQMVGVFQEKNIIEKIY